MGHPRSRNWTLDFEPAFSPRFSPTLSPRSFFHTRQRFPISNHVTSGFMSPRSFFHTRQRFPISNHVTSGCMSPRSLFHTRQRFPISNHVTSGWMSPRSSLDHWSAVTPTGNDMTSLDQSGASICHIRADFTTDNPAGIRWIRSDRISLTYKRPYI